MRSIELVGVPVRDRDGRDVGRVRDVRLHASDPKGPEQGPPAYVITALVVGPVAIAQRLGYGRGEMTGPWPLTLLFRSLARHSLVVEWSDVTRHSLECIEIRCSRSELRSVIDAIPDEDQATGGAS